MTNGRRTWNLNQKGITLVEVVVVGVLAVIVMLALTGFYINSQGTWIDASSQAVTQRELSFLAQTIGDSVHASASATANSLTHTLILYNANSSEKCTFWLNSGDSLMHQSKGGVDGGPVVASRATRFDISGDAKMVRIHGLGLKSANGRVVEMSSSAAFYNK